MGDRTWDEEHEEQEQDVIRPTEEEVKNIPEVKYEYLDHPADVQIHAWGNDLKEAYEQAAVGMFGYMTDLEAVEMVEVKEVEAEAEDLPGLLFHFLDECLFAFSCEPFFIVRKVVITDWKIGGGAGRTVAAAGGGEGEGGGGGSRNEETGGKDEGAAGGEGRSRDKQTGGKEEEQEEGGEGSKEGASAGGGRRQEEEEEEEVMRVCARLYGEEFQLGKHPQGTEVKAITYASMQVYDAPGQHEVFVIVDI